MEVLEDRRLPALTGLPWPDPGHLTLSFVPDGTPVGSGSTSATAPSALTATLDRVMPAADWKRTVLAAVQAWADKAEVNVGLVADDGGPLGQAGPLQGDPRAGDIRVAARPLSAGVLAQAAPFDLLGGWSGDIVLNSALRFSKGGENDLYTAVLHEVGHALGLGDNPSDPASAMYPADAAPKAGPDAGDVAALRALYGARRPDAYEGAAGNNTPATATRLTFADTAAIAGSLPSAADPASVVGPRGPWVVSAAVSSPADADVYSVKADGGPLAAALRAAGLSLLTARVSVLDASGRVLTSAAADDPAANDLTVTLPATAAGATYYIKVEAARPGGFAVGAYRLAVGSPGVAPLLAGSTAAELGFLPAPSVHTRFASAAELAPRAGGAGAGARWRYLAHDALTAAGRTAYEAVRAPSAPAGAMLVAVWGSVPGGLTPDVAVLDARGNPVAARVLHRDASAVSVEVLSPVPGARYVLAVSAADPAGAHAVGGFTLAATFRADPLAEDVLSSGTLDAAHDAAVQVLTVPAAGLYHFDLSGADGDPADAAARVSVTDASGSQVFTARAIGSGSGDGDVILTPGRYFVRVTAATRSGAPLSGYAYTLRGVVRTDPIGPTPTDPTLTPTDVTLDPTTSYATPLLTPVLTPVFYDFLDLTDVLINPWM